MTTIILLLIVKRIRRTNSSIYNTYHNYNIVVRFINIFLWFVSCECRNWNDCNVVVVENRSLRCSAYTLIVCFFFLKRTSSIIDSCQGTYFFFLLWQGNPIFTNLKVYTPVVNSFVYNGLRDCIFYFARRTPLPSPAHLSTHCNVVVFVGLKTIGFGLSRNPRETFSFRV